MRDKVSIDFQRAQLSARPPPSAAELRQAAEAAAAARVPAPTSKPVADALPLARRLEKIARAPAGRMVNPVLFESDLDEFEERPFDRDAWLRAMEAKREEHDFYNVHPSIVRQVCQFLADAADPANPATKGVGMMRLTMQEWADFVGCCRSTIHKVVRALWETGLLLIGNTVFWLGKDRRNGPNVYLPRLSVEEGAAQTPEASGTTEAREAPGAAPAQGAEMPASPGASPVMVRLQAAIRDLLPHFPRLAGRMFGLNTTPLRQLSLARAARESAAPS